MMSNHYEVLATCPAKYHNTLRAANTNPHRCTCPHALELREDYLARRRVTNPVRPHKRIEVPLADPLPPVRGEDAQALLARYENPPHLCVGADPELWFSSAPADIEHARDICSRCPMRKTCQQAATDNGWLGVWGESDEEERRRTRGSWTRVG